jgi:hypothetical protein
MKKRIKNKIQKRELNKSIIDSIKSDPVFCKVLATKEQLEDIGCDLDLTGCLVEWIKDYPTGYSEVRIKNEDISNWLETPIYENYDIPKYLLKFDI